jgi:hypothetical protein
MDRKKQARTRVGGFQQFKMNTPKITIALAFALLAGLPGCGEVTGNADNRFVALEALLDEQVRLLQSANPTVKKSVLAAGGTQEKTFRDVDWQKELAAFRQADLGKPGLRGAYTVQDVAPNVRLFRVKPGEKAEVQEVRVEFADGNRVKSVQALVNDENYLYHTRRTFRLDFAPRGDQWLVRTYRIEGFQKLLWNQAKPFAVRADVL